MVTLCITANTVLCVILDVLLFRGNYNIFFFFFLSFVCHSFYFLFFLFPFFVHSLLHFSAVSCFYHVYYSFSLDSFISLTVLYICICTYRLCVCLFNILNVCFFLYLWISVSLYQLIVLSLFQYICFFFISLHNCLHIWRLICPVISTPIYLLMYIPS